MGCVIFLGFGEALLDGISKQKEASLIMSSNKALIGILGI